MTWPTRYSELTWEHVAALRIGRAIEQAYPVESAVAKGPKCSVVLAGYEAWKSRTPQVAGDKSREAI
jgi:hypothetical protein